MGDYVSVATVLTEFNDELEAAHLTGDEADGTPDTDKVERAISQAEGEINKRMASRYLVGADLVAVGVTGLNSSLEADAARLSAIILIRRGPGIATFKEEEFDKILEGYNAINRGDLVLPASVTLPSTRSRDPVLPWSSSGDEESDDSQRLYSRESTFRL